MRLRDAVEEWCALYARDVAEHPDAYDPDVVADPRAQALETVRGFTTAEVRRFTRELKQERAEVAHAGR